MKRLLDLIGSIALLLSLAPLMALVALLIRLDMGAGVLFCQVRAGRHGEPFTLYKFRTMSNERDSSGELLADTERLTRFGRFLRAASLDELPQLLNVLKGDMSLVGPRPLYMKYLNYYTARELGRHAVRPGITGWAQIHGRNFLSWDERLALDVWYVEHLSLCLDFEILVKTVWLVFRRDGVAEPENAEPDLDAERLDRLSACS